MFEIKSLTAGYINKNKVTEIVKDFSFSIANTGFAVILGASGCGKSTLLKAICGTGDVKIISGQILIDGINIVPKDTQSRNLAYVSQRIVLYPHMTVYDNIALPLQTAKTPLDEVNRRVKETAEMLEIDWLLSRKPSCLSGGQQQRVAIARAIVKRPSVYLFDEPFSNLDSELREKLQHILSELHKRMNTPFVFVTHDRREAMTLATDLVVMNQGEIIQTGVPIYLYNSPANSLVKHLIHGDTL